MTSNNTDNKKPIQEFQVAAIQMASGPNVSSNLYEAQRLIGMAADAGAKLIVLPENFAIMGMDEKDKVAVKENAGSGRLQNFLAEAAKKHAVWIVGGTIPIACDDANKIRAAALIYDDCGTLVGRYDKTHLFDVHIPESGDHFVESQTIEAGNQVKVIDTPFGKLGVAICYDLRFPEVFRLMVQQGVEFIALPSAFTAITGRAHWEILVRARAIENLSYVIAADQGGYHINGRESHGESMIVDPWGNVLDRLASGSGFVTAKLSRKTISDIRRNFPALNHRKFNISQ